MLDSYCYYLDAIAYYLNFFKIVLGYLDISLRTSIKIVWKSTYDIPYAL